jgi:hypothetical protein
MAELTRGLLLPLPALQQRHLKVIAEFLTDAWNGLLETWEGILHTADEPEVNALMNSRLNNIRGSKAEWAVLVSLVTRGSESFNHDGSSIEKRPDLSVHITSRPSHLPLIVECKLIDKGTRKGVDSYCNKGLARFINGEYAYYAQEAFLLAYVRDGATIGADLKPYLAKFQKSEPEFFLTEQLPEAVNPPAQNLSQSRHGRQFQNNPGPIAIWHLWLS